MHSPYYVLHLLEGIQLEEGIAAEQMVLLACHGLTPCCLVTQRSLHLVLPSLAVEPNTFPSREGTAETLTGPSCLQVERGFFGQRDLKILFWG